MACSPLLGGVLNSKWRAYEHHVTEVKIKNTTATCCLCCQPSFLDTDENRSLKSAVCACAHPLCANCHVASDVFTQIKGLRHHVPGKDRFRYSHGFYCDGCGASNKVPPLLQLNDTASSAANTTRQLRSRAADKDWFVDFTWSTCRCCARRCHERCFLYRIKPWEQPQDPVRSPKRNRREYDTHTRAVRTRLASGAPTSPLARPALTPDEIDSDESASCSSQATHGSLTLEEMETLEYGM